MTPHRQSIAWLASYPKSGNTWVRILLANYLFANDTPLDINQIHHVGLGDSVLGLYQKVSRQPVDPDNLEQYVQLRDKVLQGIVANNAAINFVKTHNANINVLNRALLPAEYSKVVIHIVRNPLDVVVSLARQLGLEFSQAVQMLSDDKATLRGKDTMPQFTLSWSAHTHSLRQTGMRYHRVRYEDLHKNPMQSMTAMLKALDIPVDQEQLKKAIQFSRFEVVAGQEKQSGFIENTSANRFFRAGNVSGWEKELSREQVDRVIEKHAEMMQVLGYL